MEKCPLDRCLEPNQHTVLAKLCIEQSCRISLVRWLLFACSFLANLEEAPHRKVYMEHSASLPGLKKK